MYVASELTGYCVLESIAYHVAQGVVVTILVKGIGFAAYCLGFAMHLLF